MKRISLAKVTEVAVAERLSVGWEGRFWSIADSTYFNGAGRPEGTGYGHGLARGCGTISFFGGDQGLAGSPSPTQGFLAL